MSVSDVRYAEMEQKINQLEHARLQGQIDAAKEMIQELRDAILSVQRSSFDAGYRAGLAQEDSVAAYKEWSHT